MVVRESSLPALQAKFSLSLTWNLRVERNKGDQVNGRHAPEEDAPRQDDLPHVRAELLDGQALLSALFYSRPELRPPGGTTSADAVSGPDGKRELTRPGTRSGNKYTRTASRCRCSWFEVDAAFT